MGTPSDYTPTSYKSKCLKKSNEKKFEIGHHKKRTIKTYRVHNDDCNCRKYDNKVLKTLSNICQILFIVCRKKCYHLKSLNNQNGAVI